MKIKCEYCESFFDDTLEKCPNCGAPNKNVRRSTADQPTTIEGLQEWYASKGLPPEDVTRFFIGKNYEGARAFGIYKDEETGNFIVYKNKDDGSRAVRYEGTDEAFAVNELFTRLKQEILEQKSRNISKGGSVRRKKKKSKVSTIASWVIILGMSGFIGYVLYTDEPAKKGYYTYNDEAQYAGKLFYHYGNNTGGWAVYDSEESDWEKTSSVPKKLENLYSAKKYYLSQDYKNSYGAGDFTQSQIYDDSLYGFAVDKGYYSYDNAVYYHMKDSQDNGWYMYDYDDDDWDEIYVSEVPEDLTHYSSSQDFWYTPEWDSETQISDFETTDTYIEYQEELRREEESKSSSDSSSSDSSDYSWSSSDSWDSGSSDWGSDW